MEMFLEQVAPEAMDERGVRAWVNKRPRSDFNGREIRNIFSAAISRAKGEGRKLLIEDLDMFWNRANDFQRSLGPHTAGIMERQNPVGPH